MKASTHTKFMAISILILTMLCFKAVGKIDKTTFDYLAGCIGVSFAMLGGIILIGLANLTEAIENRK